MSRSKISDVDKKILLLPKLILTQNSISKHVSQARNPRRPLSPWCIKQQTLTYNIIKPTLYVCAMSNLHRCVSFWYVMLSSSIVIFASRIDLRRVHFATVIPCNKKPKGNDYIYVFEWSLNDYINVQGVWILLFSDCDWLWLLMFHHLWTLMFLNPIDTCCDLLVFFMI